MAKNPFNPRDVEDFSVKRNAFDQSHQSLFTTDWGKIMPIGVFETLPGDTFRFDGVSVNVRGMNTLFPLLTRVRASIEMYYVRNRILYKDWEDFIFKTKDGLVAPYIAPAPRNSHFAEMTKTGSLGDMLGMPTTIGSDVSFRSEFSNSEFLGVSGYDGFFSLLPNGGVVFNDSAVLNASLAQINSFFASPFKISSLGLIGTTPFKFVIFTSQVFDKYSSPSTITINQVLSSAYIGFTSASNLPDVSISVKGGLVTPVQSSSSSVFGVSSLFSDSSVVGDYRIVVAVPFSSTDERSFELVVEGSNGSLSDVFSVSGGHTETSVINFVNPFANGDIPISALPFRAYEMICNYYYRYDLNNPYRISGEPQYNQFLPSTDGGEDINFYTYHFRNYELDAFTSALQSPQFGAAPLVGLSYNVGVAPDGTPRDTATFKFEDTEGRTYNAVLGVSDDKLVDIANFDPDIPSGNLRQLQDWVNYGFSINMLRNVNGFQRFLENTVRRGLRYRNQLMSHFGVSVDYPDIDVPEYIGGFSGYLDSSQITNMSQTGEIGLGDFVGQIGGSIQTRRSISKYCPEHGFIMVMFTIYPTPMYNQSCEKYLLKHDAFDYYQTEFGKIGYVPIHYSEVQPLNLSTNSSDRSGSDVFGYQRAWYDYMMRRDVAHGDFRLSLRDFTLARNFAVRPELVQDFTQIKPEDLNHVFLNRNIATEYGSNSKFLCSAFFDCFANRPIPRHGVPSLE